MSWPESLFERRPKLSIGIPVYNGESYLPEALRAFLEQDYSDFELIVSDNASTDRTEAIVREFAARDSRIRYYRNPENLGASRNFSRVFDYARGEFFKWACADDLPYPGYLRRLTETLAAAPPEVVLVTSRVALIDGEGRPLTDEEGRPFAWTEWASEWGGPERLSTDAATPSRRLAEVLPRLRWCTAYMGIFRREALALTRKIDAFAVSDRVLMVEVAMLGKIIEIDEFLLARRQHPGISTEIAKTPEEYALWIDPKTKNVRRASRRIMSLEYLASIRRLPLSPLERVRCAVVIAKIWASQKIDLLVKRFPRNVTEVTGETVQL